MRKFLIINRFKEVFINIDEEYYPLIKNIDFKAPVTYSEGEEVKRLVNTKEWINSKIF